MDFVPTAEAWKLPANTISNGDDEHRAVGYPLWTQHNEAPKQSHTLQEIQRCNSLHREERKSRSRSFASREYLENDQEDKEEARHITTTHPLQNIKLLKSEPTAQNQRMEWHSPYKPETQYSLSQCIW